MNDDLHGRGMYALGQAPRRADGFGADNAPQLREAVFSRFSGKRWGHKCGKESHLFDMVIAMNPTVRKLGYIDRLALSEEVAEAVKRKIWQKIEGLCKKVIDSTRAAGAEVGNPAQSAPTPRSKRLKFSPSAPLMDFDHDGLGLFDEENKEETASTTASERPSAEEARQAVHEYKEEQVCSIHGTLK